VTQPTIVAENTMWKRCVCKCLHFVDTLNVLLTCRLFRNDTNNNYQ